MPGGKKSVWVKMWISRFASILPIVQWIAVLMVKGLWLLIVFSGVLGISL